MESADVGLKMRAAREEQGLSLRDVEARLKAMEPSGPGRRGKKSASFSHLGHMEKGSARIAIDSLSPWAQALGLRVEVSLVPVGAAWTMVPVEPRALVVAEDLDALTNDRLDLLRRAQLTLEATTDSDLALFADLLTVMESRTGRRKE